MSSRYALPQVSTVQTDPAPNPNKCKYGSGQVISAQVRMGVTPRDEGPGRACSVSSSVPGSVGPVTNVYGTATSIMH